MAELNRRSQACEVLAGTGNRVAKNLLEFIPLVARSFGPHDFVVKIPPDLVACLAAAKRVTVFTGAGVSAESDVPTFRDAQTGLWADFKAEDLATPSGFLRNPRLVWEWYEWRRQLVARAEPNPAHRAIAEMERLFPQFTLITQNVDGLHQRAGSSKVVELHGNITRTKCFQEGTLVADWEPTGTPPPKCPRCGGLLRPDVVWFHESLPEAECNRAWEVASKCDVFLSIGTSTVVYPAAQLPFEALRGGATTVEINPDPTPFTPKARFALPGKAGVVLPLLLAELKGARK